MSKVSIVIPAYNQGRFLRAAVESALRQTHRDLEVVVVDDGSTDDTPSVAAAFSGRIRYVRQDNAGLAGARNRGIRESTGDYLCFLDSDDWLDPLKIERQAEILDADPALGFVYCDVVTVDEAGEPVAEQYSVADTGRLLTGNLFPSLILGGYFPPHTVLVRRGILETVGHFDPALGGHADYDLWLRISAAGHPAYFLPEKRAFYRTYPGSMSKDGQHMGETRAATFRKLARLHPDGVGNGLHRLQEANEDLYQANQWLQRNWNELLANAGTMRSAPEAAEGNRFTFLNHLQRARQTRGSAEQMTTWEVILNERRSRALLLQPPAEVVFTVPTGAWGKLTTAVALHPDVWNRKESGGCEFCLRVDGRAALVLALDPTHLPTDRRWHDVCLDVPETSSGQHQVILETKGISRNDFRWALWREPVFSWNGADRAAPVPSLSQPSTL